MYKSELMSILTEEEILKADEIIKNTRNTEARQLFQMANEQVKLIIRYFVLLPKDRQEKLYEAI